MLPRPLAVAYLAGAIGLGIQLEGIGKCAAVEYGAVDGAVHVEVIGFATRVDSAMSFDTASIS